MNSILVFIAIFLVLIISIVLLVVVLTKVGKNTNADGIDTNELANQINLSIDNKMELLKQSQEFNAKATDEKITKLSNQMQELTEKNYQQQLKLMETLNSNAQNQNKVTQDAISKMTESNEKKLDEMRKVVDEKLTETLNKRISSSFTTVSEQLEKVYKSLGEMKELSNGVTTSVSGLNKILTNVKSRGTWAEVQLGNILDQTIPGMYETNVKTNPSYNGQVEFAVKIPNQEDGGCTYLPIDSKFPMEDYARLSNAAEVGDIEALEASRKALEARVLSEGKTITQYIASPYTTPFAILYLATEGLYAEIIASKNGVSEKLQELGIMVAGPSTITALLNSLAMGFRTIAINEKANEVWKVLGEAKGQYDKFGVLLAKAKKKVQEAEKTLDEADHRNEIIQKKLRNVETLEITDSPDLIDTLGLDE